MKNILLYLLFITFAFSSNQYNAYSQVCSLDMRIDENNNISEIEDKAFYLVEYTHSKNIIVSDRLYEFSEENKIFKIYSPFDSKSNIESIFLTDTTMIVNFKSLNMYVLLCQRLN